MEPFKIDARIELAVKSSYRCPRISEGWLRMTCRSIVESHGCEPDFNIAKYRQEVEEAIKYTSFHDTAEQGTGLPNRINQDRVNDLIEGPVVLEVVHMTDIGVSALSLERVRQYRDHRTLHERIAHAGSSEGQAPREPEWLRSRLDKYPRKRLKLFLSDGFIELQAIELEDLPFELGVTTMGTKIRLKNVPIVEGVAYLRKDNVTEIGGSVEGIQKQHRWRFWEDLDRRMDDDEEDAMLGGTSPERLYLSHT